MMSLHSRLSLAEKSCQLPGPDDVHLQGPLPRLLRAAVGGQVRDPWAGWLFGWGLYAIVLYVMLYGSLHPQPLWLIWHKLINWPEGVLNDVRLVFEGTQPVTVANRVITRQGEFPKPASTPDHLCVMLKETRAERRDHVLVALDFCARLSVCW